MYYLVNPSGEFVRAFGHEKTSEEIGLAVRIPTHRPIARDAYAACCAVLLLPYSALMALQQIPLLGSTGLLHDCIRHMLLQQLVRNTLIVAQTLQSCYSLTNPSKHNVSGQSMLVCELCSK